MFAKNKEPPDWVKTYLDVEFKEVGRSELCDCWGLVRRILLEQYDIEVPRYDEYESTKELEKLASLMEEGRLEDEWFEVHLCAVKTGDVVLFKIRGQLCHVGFCLSHGYMLHIQKGKNACIEDYLGLRWKKRIHSFYRHEKLM